MAHNLLAQTPAASMNEIAKRAGVGAGMLYRHFPAREDLILAVCRHDIDRLVAGAASMSWCLDCCNWTPPPR